ncbi:hypothetical protein AV654_02605 [Paenibacillus elgii]|uniref:Uncharacterized protein n=1 Tax=Paenibacillus elgii TaxID=189691 RepID=A0A163XYP1_9BACL|nr:hypothetical protein AV654_02605 [Paenibacillus elgii]
MMQQALGRLEAGGNLAFGRRRPFLMYSYRFFAKPGRKKTCGNGGSHIILVYTIIRWLSGRDAGESFIRRTAGWRAYRRLTGATETAGVSGYY